jgi:hypothetical protein
MSILTQQLPAYPYLQYFDDADIAAFFTAYNNFSQTNLDTINALNLPNYQAQVYPLLDYVGENLYGEKRTALAVGTSQIVGPLNTYNYNQITPNFYQVFFNGTTYQVSDGVFKAILQWNNFKGDGFQFTVRWLKRRARRFINGNPFINNTYDVSVTFSAPTVCVITVPASSTYGTVFQAAVASGVLLLPFQYQFSVTLV